MKTFTDDEVGALLDALCELYAEKYPYPGSRTPTVGQGGTTGLVRISLTASSTVGSPSLSFILANPSWFHFMAPSGV